MHGLSIMAISVQNLRNFNLLVLTMNSSWTAVSLNNLSEITDLTFTISNSNLDFACISKGKIVSCNMCVVRHLVNLSASQVQTLIQEVRTMNRSLYTLVLGGAVSGLMLGVMFGEDVARATPGCFGPGHVVENRPVLCKKVNCTQAAGGGDICEGQWFSYDTIPYTLHDNSCVEWLWPSDTGCQLNQVLPIPSAASLCAFSYWYSDDECEITCRTVLIHKPFYTKNGTACDPA